MFGNDGAGFQIVQLLFIAGYFQSSRLSANFPTTIFCTTPLKTQAEKTAFRFL